MQLTLRTGFVLAAGLAVSGLAAATATAVEIPCNTARIIVPWGAGGESDIFARVAAEVANKAGVKPQMQVVIISGQGGIKGAKQAKEAKPDGCTLFNIHQHVLASHLTGRMEFTWDSYIPVARMTQTISIIGAGSKAPFNNYKEMQAWAKANPNSLLAGGTLGSTSHFTLLQVADALGITLKVVSYDGTADRIKAMLANTIHIGQVSEATGAEHAKTGNLKLIAVNYSKRSPVLPDVPTAAEQGFPIEIATDRGMMLPLGTPDDVVKHYDDVFAKVAKDPEFIKVVEGMGSFVSYLGPKEYTAWWKETMTDWEGIAKRLGVYRQASN